VSFYTEQDEEDEAAAWRHGRRYRQILNQFPDCRDPDHPGCELCNQQEPRSNYDTSAATSV